MTWLPRELLAEPFRVEELARSAGMGPSVFHRHFKAVTAMTPIQYQKRLRLHEARRRLITQPGDAAGAAFAVGYESASQFHRVVMPGCSARPRPVTPPGSTQNVDAAGSVVEVMA